MIHKIIHQIWFQGSDQVPDKFIPNIQSVKDKNSDWQYMLWDDVSIRKVLQAKAPEYLSKYDSYKIMHQKIDYGRYALLYIYGGVSVDIDCMAIKSFNGTPNLQSSDFIVSNLRHNGNKLNNAIIFSSAGNSILKDLLDNLPSDCSSYQNNYSCIQSTTGPDAFNKIVKKYPDQITILDNIYFEPCPGMDDQCEINEESILNHKHELSWIGPFHKGAIKFYYFLKKNIVIILVVVIIIVLFIFSFRKSS